VTRRIRVWGFIAALLGATPALASDAGAVSAPSKPAWCAAQAAEGVGAGDVKFAPLASKFATGETLSIVAIGSSSTAGSDLPDAKLAYPAHLHSYLNSLYGAARVSVLNKGKGGEAIADTVRRFGDDVVAVKPDLVIWQLGANDIVRGVEIGAAEAGVSEGLALLAAAGIPVVLMDSQAAPKVMAGASREAMDRMLRRAARSHGVPYWSRYDLMLAIKASGKATSKDLTRADDLHMTVAMHVCTATALGDALAGYLTRSTVTAQR
jgi:lysophospholipase L1-like esterase